jgi:SAM-dependent methyltransferase
VAERVEFRVADAQDLPFEDDLFDAVITESVTSLPEDKQQAVGEYVRVTRSGGYVGLAESTWLEALPPPELVAWVSQQDAGVCAQPLTADEWAGLLENAGLQDITVHIHPVDAKKETRLLLRRYGCGGMMGNALRMLSMYLRNPAYRAFLKSVRGGVLPENLVEYFGYGVYVGRKA